MYRTALCCIVLLAAPAVVTAQQPTAPPPPPPPLQPAVPHDSVRGAIRAIDVRARMVDVSTGVGYALRVVRLQVPASVTIKDRQQAISLAQLQLGDVVHAQFGGHAAPFVVYTIERVGSVTTGAPRAP